MKIRINPGAVPATVCEPQREAADSPFKPVEQELEIEIDREFADISVVNSELVEEFAENVKVKIDNRIAKKAFLISRRKDFGQGSSAVDWADRMQAEINKQGNLRTHYSDRRNLADNDRRRKVDED